MVVELEVSDEPWFFTDAGGNIHEIVDGFFSECLLCGNIIQVMFKEDGSQISLCDTRDCKANYVPI